MNISLQIALSLFEHLYSLNTMGDWSSHHPMPIQKQLDSRQHHRQRRNEQKLDTPMQVSPKARSSSGVRKQVSSIDRCEFFVGFREQRGAKGSHGIDDAWSSYRPDQAFAYYD